MRETNFLSQLPKRITFLRFTYINLNHTKGDFEKYITTAATTLDLPFWQYLVPTLTFNRHTPPLVMTVKTVSDLFDIRFSQRAKVVIQPLWINFFFVWTYFYFIIKNKVCLLRNQEQNFRLRPVGQFIIICKLYI